MTVLGLAIAYIDDHSVVVDSGVGVTVRWTDQYGRDHYDAPFRNHDSPLRIADEMVQARAMRIDHR